MKKLLLIPFIILLFSAKADRTIFDDTASLQTLFNSGDCVLTAGHTYTVSGTLTVTHAVDFNHAAIVSTITGNSIPVIKLSAAGASIRNGTVQGPWDYTTAASTTGYLGVRVLANNCVIDNMIINQFSSYGILCQNFSGLTVNNCSISKTGYLGFYFDPEQHNINGGTFTNNIVDRSMISGTTIIEACAEIRASVNAVVDTSYNWTITGNTFKMPPVTHAPTNECFEGRYLADSRVSNNTCIGGTIGLSLVRCRRMAVDNNIVTGSTDCGIEFADTQNSHLYRDSVNSAKDGFLFDGGVNYCRYDTVNSCIVRNPTTGAFHSAANTRRIVITGCDFQTTTKGVNLQKTDTVSIINTKIDGMGVTNTYGIFEDNSPGQITITAGSIIRCSYAVFAYNQTVSQVVNNIIGTNTLLTGTPIQFGGNFTNGAHYGTNNYFINTPLVFNPIPTKIYGTADFDPGATSTLLITYTSANTAVATIVSGKIHIVAAGTSNITANDGASTITRTLTVSKAPLIIVANSFNRKVNTPNPTFTATYVGFVLGETSAVLTHAPVLSTTATLTSPAGLYTITNTSATAANYSITNVNGVLNIYSSTYIRRKAVVLK